MSGRDVTTSFSLVPQNNANGAKPSYSSTDHLYRVPDASSGSEHIFSSEEPPAESARPADPPVPLSVKAASSSLDASEHSKTYQSRPAFSEHLGKHRQYWRDIILGVNDGLVSTFLLVAGVSGGGLPTNDVLLTAIAGSIAGAVSMYAGEFVATKSQNEVLTGEIALEHHHVREYRSDELMELSGLLTLIGIPDRPSGGDAEDGGGTAGGDGDDRGGRELRNRMMSFYEHNPDALLKIMVALEFGVLEDELRSPCAAGLTSCGLFFLGSLPSVIPFAVVADPTRGLVAAGIATATALFAVGAIKTWATRGGWLEAAVENFLIAGVGGAFAYGVGVGFEHLIRDDES